MPRFAANLSMLFTEQDFLVRFQAAANAGFHGVEYLFPYDYNSADIKAQPRLIAVEKAFRPAAKLMIQGGKVSTPDYLREYCRDALWRRAIELLQQKHATTRQIEHLTKICIEPSQQADFKTLLNQRP